ncbi:MAG: 50S ribosomal protein L17 [Atopobiaceae bacterium]|nr:50S ribosomal protein L17 [Atopobiaceae bacterium]
MRHNKKKGMKLGTDASHTKAMKRSLVCALLTHDRIKTTLQRAKAIRPEVDAVVTWAKRGDLASRRLAIAKIGDAELVREVFEKAEQGLWADRNGGYTRIMRLGNRKGDNAEMVLIEMVNESVVKKAPKNAAPAPAPAPKKVEKVEETIEVVEAEAEEAVEEATEE